MRRILLGSSMLRLLVAVFPAILLSPLAASALSRPTVPLIFIHGIASSASTWDQLSEFLIDNGWMFGGTPEFNPATGFVSGLTTPTGGADFYTMNFSDHALPFPSQNLTFEQQGIEVSAVVEAILDENPGANQVILVGHSMGGLAARSYIQSVGVNRYRDDVMQLITIGTPHQGAPVASICQSVPICILKHIDTQSVAVEELLPNSFALQQLNNLTAHPLPVDTHYVSIAGVGKTVPFSGQDGDGIVTSASQHLANVGLPGGLPYKAVSIAIADCGGVFQTHTCEPGDLGVRVEFLLDVPRFSTTWRTVPPGAVRSGENFLVSWDITGGRSFGHTNVHYDTISDLSPDTCLNRPTCQTSLRQDAENGTFSANMSAPVVNGPTTYFFAVHAEIDGFDGFSTTFSVVVSPSLGDTSSPTNVHVTAPMSGQTVSGTLVLQAIAHDNSGTIKKVEFYVDSDSTPGCSDLVAKGSGSTFQCGWGTTSRADGNHTVRAKAFDAAGNFTFSPSVSFTLSNSASHILTITTSATGTPNPVTPGGQVRMSVVAVDSLSHALSYSWTASCPTLQSNGSFTGSGTQTPTWTAPANDTGAAQTCAIQVAVGDGVGLTQPSSYTQTVSPGGVSSVRIVDGLRLVESSPYQLNGAATVDATIKNIGASTLQIDRIGAKGKFVDGVGFVFDRGWSAVDFSPPLQLAPNATYRYTRRNDSDVFPGVATTATVMLYMKFFTIAGENPVTQAAPDATAQLVFAIGHTIDITNGPAGSQDPVSSGGTITINMNANDSLGHGLSFAWSSSCSGLASQGSFSNVRVQNPTWTAPANGTGATKDCIIGVTINDTQGFSKVASYTQKVSPVHTLAIAGGPAGSANPVSSGRVSTLNVTAIDSLGHTLTYAWTALCPGLSSNGSFSNAGVQSPTWTAPANSTEVLQICTIAVNIGDGQGLSQSGSYDQGVTPHTLTMTSGPGGVPNPIASGGTATLSVAAVDSVNHGLSYTWTAGCPGLPSNGVFGGTNAQNVTWSAPANRTGAEQSCTVEVTVNDGQGLSRQSSYTHRVRAAIDTTPPIPGIVTPWNTRYGNFVSRPFELRTTFTDAETPVVACQYTVDGGRTWSAATVVGAGSAFECVQTGIAGINGQVLTVNMRATSGGGTRQGTAIQVRVDGAAPTGSVKINGSASYTSSPNVTLALALSDTSGVSEVCLSNIPSCSAWQPFASTKTAMLLTGDGTKTVYVWARDRVGNVTATPFTDQIMLDTVAPTNPSSVTSTSHTLGVWSRDRTVDVRWAGASDGTSGVYGHSIKWDTAATSLPDTTVDTTAASTTGPSLPDGRSHYFHLRTRDAAGNWTPGTVHLGPFFIDGTPPINGTLTAVPGSGRVSLLWSGFSDASSGLAPANTYRLMVATSGYPPSACASGTEVFRGTASGFTHTNLLAGTTYYYRLCAVDGAGNVSTGATRSAVVQ